MNHFVMVEALAFVPTLILQPDPVSLVSDAGDHAYFDLLLMSVLVHKLQQCQCKA